MCKEMERQLLHLLAFRLISQVRLMMVNGEVLMKPVDRKEIRMLVVLMLYHHLIVEKKLEMLLPVGHLILKILILILRHFQLMNLLIWSTTTWYIKIC